MVDELMGCVSRIVGFVVINALFVTLAAGIGQLILSWRHRPRR